MGLILTKKVSIINCSTKLSVGYVYFSYNIEIMMKFAVKISVDMLELIYHVNATILT